MKETRTAMRGAAFLLGTLLALGPSGCGPCQPVEEAPDPVAAETPELRETERAAVPVGPAEPQRAPGIETNLVDVAGWDSDGPPQAISAREAARTYRSDGRTVLVQMWHADEAALVVQPRYEVGYERTTATQHVRKIEIDGHRVRINYHPGPRMGSVHIALPNGKDTMRCVFNNMEMEEAIAFARNFIRENL